MNVQLQVQVNEALQKCRERGLAREKYLQQKAKIDWLNLGDQNTAYFHRVIQQRQYRKRIMQIKDGATTLTEYQAVTDHFVKFYKDLLGTRSAVREIDESVLEQGPRLTLDMQLELIRPFTKEDVKQAMFSISSTKSPGPDGSGYFKAAWRVIGDEVTAAILEFFNHGKLLKQVNSTLLSLIPKVENPSYASEFRPIACCNSIYKCMSKMLTGRLASVLPYLVNENQGAFTKGRSIIDNVLISQELIRLYNRKSASPRCLMKIDIQKAYDSVEWHEGSVGGVKISSEMEWLDLRVCDNSHILNSA